jgi:hypothetical protein
MTTARLFRDKDILGFLQAQIEPRDQIPWLFVHVPEAVGYTIRESFADILQPDYLVTAAQGDNGLDYDTCMFRGLQKFEQQDFRRCRLASGHFKVFQIEEIPDLAKARLFTVMRDPVDRLLCDFSAQNSTKSRQLTPQHFFEFAKAPANQNVFLQFMCPKRMWNPKECIDFIQNRFDFIGIAEDLPMTMKMFYAIHGARFLGGAKELKIATGRLKRSDLSPDLIRSVSILNAVDYDIFRWFHDQFISLKNEFFAMADCGEMFKALTYRP